MMVAKGKRGFSAGHERLAGLFEPDVLLPAQFFAAFRRAGGLERERLLMLAVLEDAVDCYQKYAHARDLRGRQLFDESRDWVQSPDRTWLFSFENICDTLEISAEYVRRGLREWRARGGRRGKIVALPTSDAVDLSKATA
ncbi:MAG: hypothetical protein E6J68_09930 [Deltaproteobacteria bacterium]|nr:MAG: hypothetical protein E6J68_09930 [Deltaproteobacteria bacterium]TMA67706.1 MAG: hypothetical protein E6J69_09090 [Deltaproteobacteria bacterium]TMB46994.1 MAG: hypothetical protein E6J55_01060 [Deltaproteobacteria bacterium]